MQEELFCTLHMCTTHCMCTITVYTALVFQSALGCDIISFVTTAASTPTSANLQTQFDHLPLHGTVLQCAALSPLRCSTGAGLWTESRTTAGACQWVADALPEECYALAGCPTAICQEDGTWWVGCCWSWPPQGLLHNACLMMRWICSLQPVSHQVL